MTGGPVSHAGPTPSTTYIRVNDGTGSSGVDRVADSDRSRSPQQLVRDMRQQQRSTRRRVLDVVDDAVRLDGLESMLREVLDRLDRLERLSGQSEITEPEQAKHEQSHAGHGDWWADTGQNLGMPERIAAGRALRGAA